MIIPSVTRQPMRSLASLVLVVAALVAVPATQAGAAAANAAAGIGTAAAKGSSLCDPTTGRIKIPAYLASVCVRPWERAHGTNAARTIPAAETRAPSETVAYNMKWGG